MTATMSSDPGPLRFVVAIPARNEAERIGACLAALGRQRGIAPGTIGVLLFLNACTDDTRAVAEDASAALSIPVRIVEGACATPSAGWARREAMEAALAWQEEAGGRDGILLTSDADSRVGDTWVALNAAAIAAGADAVAGRIVLDPVEAAALPEGLHRRGRLEATYEALLTEIGARIDPEPGNPWPCHWGRSGATIAVKAAVYRAVGGMPDTASGEDRAFIDAVRAARFVVRQAPEIEVVTSGRLAGRAADGVAETIRRRCEQPEAFCDDRLEGLGRFLLRSFIGRLLRRRLAARRPAPAWLQACAFSPNFAYRPLRPAALPRQIERARLVNHLLRAVASRRREARRADSVPSVRCGSASRSSTPRP